jgi:hypothetical protein
VPVDEAAQVEAPPEGVLLDHPVPHAAHPRQRRHVPHLHELGTENYQLLLLLLLFMLFTIII